MMSAILLDRHPGPLGGEGHKRLRELPDVTVAALRVLLEALQDHGLEARGTSGRSPGAPARLASRS